MVAMRKAALTGAASMAGSGQAKGAPWGRPGLVSLGEADRHEQVQVAVLVGGADQRRLEPVLEFEDDLPVVTPAMPSAR